MNLIKGRMIKAICAVVVGVLLVMDPDKMGTLLVQIVGAMFVIPGLFAIVTYFMRHTPAGIRHPFFFNLMLGIGSLLAGGTLILFPSYFVSALLILLGLVVLIAGYTQLRGLMLLRKVTVVPAYNYYPAVLLLCLGVLILVNPDFIQNFAFTLLGCGLIFFFLVELLQCIFFNKAYRTYEKQHLSDGRNNEDIEEAEILEETTDK